MIQRLDSELTQMFKEVWHIVISQCRIQIHDDQVGWIRAVQNQQQGGMLQCVVSTAPPSNSWPKLLGHRSMPPLNLVPVSNLVIKQPNGIQQ